MVVMLSASLHLLCLSCNRWHDRVSQRLDISFTEITGALRWMCNVNKKASGVSTCRLIVCENSDCTEEI
jgi:hypothetical protein